jgi:2-polyprenyl-3-methyl-5-hydroxy-6-metoxy-1,4-benzoquinol methylase
MNQQEFYNKLMSEDDHYGAKRLAHGWPGNFHRWRIKVLRNIFTDYLKCKKETRILDIGSGISLFGEMFPREICPEITAFDVSDVVVERGKKMYPHIKFLGVDDAQNPSLSGEWDIVFAGEIIEHIADPKVALANWANLLKKGGYMVVTTPNRMFNRKNEEHISLLTIGKMKNNLKAVGLKVVRIVGIDIFNPLIDLVLNKISKHFPEVSDRLFQIKMKSTLRLPSLAHDITYIARKL